MFKHFCFKKLSYCYQYILCLLASSLVLFLNCSQSFDNPSLAVLTKCVHTKKSVTDSSTDPLSAIQIILANIWDEVFISHS